MEKDKAETEGDETCVQCTHTTKVRHTEYSPASQPAYESANSTGVQKVATPAFLLTSLTATACARSETKRAGDDGGWSEWSGVEWMGRHKRRDNGAIKTAAE